MSASFPLRVVDARTPAPFRDTSRPVLLIGFQRHSNLGLGYLASNLRRHGYRVEVFDFEMDRAAILQAARSLDPVLVGFSLIFQSYAAWFGSLIAYLRDNGVTCHFTMGGHFPSLSYERTLELIPELDSVVRFEGEETLLELVDRLGSGGDWHDVAGLAYRDGPVVVASAMRALVDDLDTLPYPERTFKRNAILGRNVTPMLASRGCARTCSFCSIHMFYRTAPGRIVRTRKPAEVVREMRMLLDQHDITIFLFQDDDFPLFGPVWRRWAKDFVAELHRADLPGRVAWKINCRADAVDRDLFVEMRDAGLYMVYGPRVRSRRRTQDAAQADQRRTEHSRRRNPEGDRAIFEYGFMLLDPSSTFETVRANVDFLRTIVGDGSAGVTFGRMVPYDGTPIKDDLERTGRLRGDVGKPDYDFLDPRLTEFYEAVSRIIDVTGWTHGYRALSPALNFAWDEVAIIEQLFPIVPDLQSYKASLRSITAASNEDLLRVIEDTASAVEQGRPQVWSAEVLQGRCRDFVDRLVSTRDAFVLRNQALLLEALQRDAQPA